MFLVEEVVSDGKDVECMVLPTDYPETLAVKISTPAEYFKGEDAQLDWKIKKNCDEFAYGAVITTHKAQGSSYPHVLILDQSKVFGVSAKNWLYTALTRASEKVTVFV
jgi:exodeoxyribonuclease-5